MVLENKGLFATYFQDPFVAIKYVEQNKDKIHLIVTDYHMPGLTGLQMMRKIHAFKEVPYLLLSGLLSQIDDDYSKFEIKRMEKPFCEDKLFDALKDYLPAFEKSS